MPTNSIIIIEIVYKKGFNNMMLVDKFNEIIGKNIFSDNSALIKDYAQLEQALTAFQQSALSETSESRYALCETIYSDLDKYSTVFKAYILSFLTILSQSHVYTNCLLKLLLNTNDFTANNLFFIYYQITSKRFTNINLGNNETDELMSLVYKKVYNTYKTSLSNRLQFIPKEERNSNLIIVFISQFLSLNHGPTKTILDRCLVIKNHIHKTPFIINTSEFLPLVGFTPFFCATAASYDNELLNNEQVEYQGENFSFLQCENNMPNTEDIGAIVNIVKRLKPYCIFNIGGSSILNDICSNIIPTITISTVPSERCMTEGQFQVIGRPITNNDKIWMKQEHKSPDHIIECRFTSSFKQQENKFSRSDLGLPADLFIGLVVGARLDLEITDDFIQILYKAMGNNIFIVFMGLYNHYEDICEQYPIFKTNSKYLGFMSDVLAVNECCDIYINPKRIGGGTSVAESFSKGLPAVTLNYGDVGLGAGEDFFVSDYDDMLQTLIKYAQDREFYAKMSQKALARAHILSNSTAEFIKVLSIAEKSLEF